MKTQEAQGLQEQRDQYYGHLQQYIVAYQQLSAEKEELHKQFLLQTQLMDRLQHEEVQGKVTVEMHLKELQQTKVTGKRGKWKAGRKSADLHEILIKQKIRPDDLAQSLPAWPIL